MPKLAPYLLSLFRCFVPSTFFYNVVAIPTKEVGVLHKVRLVTRHISGRSQLFMLAMHAPMYVLLSHRTVRLFSERAYFIKC